MLYYLQFEISYLFYLILINGYEKERSTNSSNQKIYSHDLCSSLSMAKILSHLTPNLIDKHISTSYVTLQPTWTYYILILSMIIMSIGASPFYTLGIIFLTDHLNKDDQAICTSLIISQSNFLVQKTKKKLKCNYF